MAGKSKAQRAAEKREQLVRLQEAADGTMTVYVTERGWLFCCVACHISEQEWVHQQRYGPMYGNPLISDEKFQTWHPGWALRKERWLLARLVGRSCNAVRCKEVHKYRDEVDDLTGLVAQRKPVRTWITRQRSRTTGALKYKARKRRGKEIVKEQAMVRKRERLAAGIVETRGRPKSEVPEDERKRLYQANAAAKRDAKRAADERARREEYASATAESWEWLPGVAFCQSCGLTMVRTRHNMEELGRGIVSWQGLPGQKAPGWQWGCDPCMRAAVEARRNPPSMDPRSITRASQRG